VRLALAAPWRDVAFDVSGGEVLERSVPLVRAGGTLVAIVGPPKVRPADGRPNRYRIRAHLPLPEPTARERTVGEVLALLTGEDAPAT
jgi:NADPH:quinone reductase-like Zn-dependent oxidoreductase